MPTIIKTVEDIYMKCLCCEHHYFMKGHNGMMCGLPQCKCMQCKHHYFPEDTKYLSCRLDKCKPEMENKNGSV